VYAFRHEIDAWLTRKNLSVISGSQPEQDETWQPHEPEPATEATKEAIADEAAGDAPSPEGSKITDAGAAGPKPGIVTPVDTRGSRYLRLFGLGLVVLAAVLGLALLKIVPGRDANPDPLRTPQAVDSRPLTTMSGIERTPELSPDGRQVVFAWQHEDGQVDLYLRMLDQAQVLQLTDDAAVEESPVYSPDGLSIAYLRWGEAGQRELRVIPVLGGTPRTLEQFPVPLWMDEARSMSAAVTWHPGGQWLAVTAQAEDPNTTRIVAWSLQTGEQRPLTDPPAGSSDLAPAFSPDGGQLAFTRSASAHNGSLLLARVALAGEATGPSPVQTLPQATPWDYDPAWSLDGNELVFSGGRYPNTRLWRIAVDGSTPASPFAGTELGGGSPSMAIEQQADSGQAKWRLAYSSLQLDNDIWQVSLQDGSRHRLLGSSQRERFPVYSPDGRRIMFISDRGGYREIWGAAAEGQPNPEPWTDWKSSTIWRPAWSPDGSLLAYVVERDNVLQLFVQEKPLIGARQLSVDNAGDDDLAWSRDGQSLFTLSFNRHEAGPAIYRYPLAGGAPEFVVNSASIPVGEDAGSRLYLKTSEGGDARLEVYDPRDQALRPVPLSVGLHHSFTMGPDGIYFVAVVDGSAAIRRWNFASQADEWVVGLESEPEAGLSIDPTGSRAALAEISLMRGDLMLAEGL
jgi:Tol biopolymer transport system component